jgi:hypothetical protein
MFSKLGDFHMRLCLLIVIALASHSFAQSDLNRIANSLDRMEMNSRSGEAARATEEAILGGMRNMQIQQLQAVAIQLQQQNWALQQQLAKVNNDFEVNKIWMKKLVDDIGAGDADAVGDHLSKLAKVYLRRKKIDMKVDITSR